MSDGKTVAHATEFPSRDTSVHATHLHSLGHAVELGGLEPHALGDAQWLQAPVRQRLGQRLLGQRAVARDVVHQHQAVLVLQCHRALPHHRVVLHERERERNVLVNDTLNTFYLRLYGFRLHLAPSC